MRLRFALYALVLSLGAPIGWAVISSVSEPDPTGRLLYAYLTFSTATVFSAFGYVVGRYYDRVRELNDRDALTKLLNQESFLRRTQVHFDMACRYKEWMAILMIDLDHLKALNDEHNHLLGTHVLKEVAKIIEQSTRKTDLSARYGGDEYVVCLPRTNEESAKRVADRICQATADSVFETSSASARATVSIGIVALICDDGVALEDLIRGADEAVYAAKRAGRNQVRLGRVQVKASEAEA